MPAKEIAAFAKTLRLSYISSSIELFLNEAAIDELSFEEALELLLDRECQTRRINGIARRIKRAKFPYQMNMQTFEVKHLRPEIRREIKKLETLDFIHEKSNVILIGNPGVGKTALSVALGMKACESELNVAFINVPNLVIEIKEAMSLSKLQAYKRSFEKYDLVILDDLGYCSFDKECGEVLFNLLSNRNEKGSMIITTNLMFDRWNEVFNDQILTGAIVDRIAHRAHAIDMTGDSYRVLETKKWIEEEGKVK